MDKKVALVLSGGGALGAFQVGAEKYAREKMGYQWDIIAGVSVGALNGVMLATKRYKELWELWETITEKQAYTGKLNAWGLLRMVIGYKSALGNKPLQRILDREVKPYIKNIDVDLTVGAVSYTDGLYYPFSPGDKGFYEAILASTAIPLIWSPVEVPTKKRVHEMVDGGVRNITPLGGVIDKGAREIVIINCFRRDGPKAPESLRTALHIGEYTVQVVMNEIFVNDIRVFERMNRLMRQTNRKIELRNRKGRVYEDIPYTIIEPAYDEPLEDMLKFNPRISMRRMKEGEEAAKKAFAAKET